MGLTYEEAQRCGIAHLWPDASKRPRAVEQPAVSNAPDDGMNKLERAFWERLQQAEGQHYREGLTFRLAGRTRYTPDFATMVLHATDHRGLVITCWEVKGFMRDDAAVKLKVVADLFPAIRFVLVTRERRRWQCRFVTHTGIRKDYWTPDWLA
jgi:hypothetical protein